MKKNAVTLMELIVVVIIIGILATLGTSQYFNFREKALDKEAQSNLRLIIAAEKIQHLETEAYQAYATTALINTNLHLAIPNPANPAWNYSVTAPAAGGAVATATRNVVNNGRDWCMDNDDEDPRANCGGGD